MAFHLQTLIVTLEVFCFSLEIKINSEKTLLDESIKFVHVLFALCRFSCSQYISRTYYLSSPLQ